MYVFAFSFCLWFKYNLWVGVVYKVDYDYSY